MTNDSVVPVAPAVEQILVVPTSLFRRLGYFHGFSRDIDRYLPELLMPENISFRPRPEMERDPEFKQLIPYAIFLHRAADGCQHVFQYTRGSGQGEGRLHRKRSVGIGGHISSLDLGTDGRGNPYEEGMQRELDEEVEIGSEYQSRCVGLINDDESEVGRVHLGVVHIIEVAQPCVRPRESEILESGFRPVHEILADMEGFETWSQICMKALFSR
jgi:predicted NUDIX family phosphoesterase